MRITKAAESGSSADWSKALSSAKIARWTDNDCMSVVSAMTSNLILDSDAKKLWKKLEKKEFSKTKRRLSKALGRRMMEEMTRAMMPEKDSEDSDSQRNETDSSESTVRPRSKRTSKKAQRSSPKQTPIPDSLPTLPTFNAVYSNKEIFQAQVDVCSDLNQLISDGEGDASLDAVLQLAPHERPILLVCVDGRDHC